MTPNIALSITIGCLTFLGGIIFSDVYHYYNNIEVSKYKETVIRHIILPEDFDRISTDKYNPSVIQIYRGTDTAYMKSK